MDGYEDNKENKGPVTGRWFSVWHKRIEQREREGRWQSVLRIILIIILLSVILYIVFNTNQYGASVRIMDNDIKIETQLAPVADPLNFGNLAPGSSKTMTIDLKNNITMPVFGVVLVIGNINDIMSVNKYFFHIGIGESVKLEFLAYVPDSAQVNNDYTGGVYVIRIPTFGL